jgi:hypothetical protein
MNGFCSRRCSFSRSRLTTAVRRRMGAAVGLVDPLDHFLTPLMFEIDADVRRLTPLGRDEPLEQQLGSHRVDRGDAEHTAGCGVRGRATSLAQYLTAPGFGDDRVDCQEIGA